MTTRRGFVLSLARTALLPILLVVMTAGAIGDAVAQDDDVEAGLEANLDRIARETAALRELPPLPEIDDVPSPRMSCGR
jgi:hypothetical protein